MIKATQRRHPSMEEETP